MDRYKASHFNHMKTWNDGSIKKMSAYGKLSERIHKDKLGIVPVRFKATSSDCYYALNLCNDNITMLIWAISWATSGCDVTSLSSVGNASTQGREDR